MPAEGTVMGLLQSVYPSAIGALIGGGWVQSKYPSMPLWKRIFLGIFTTGCVFIGVTALIALSPIFGYPFPAGIYALTSFIIAVICIPICEWLPIAAKKFFSKKLGIDVPTEEGQT